MIPQRAPSVSVTKITWNHPDGSERSETLCRRHEQNLMYALSRVAIRHEGKRFASGVCDLCPVTESAK